MLLTPQQRRKRLDELIRQDPDCRTLLTEYHAANQAFTKATDRKPRKTQELLWSLPGAGYFLHHRILALVCKHMRFEDELKP